MTMRLTFCLQSLTNLETQIMIGSLDSICNFSDVFTLAFSRLVIFKNPNKASRSNLSKMKIFCTINILLACPSEVTYSHAQEPMFKMADAEQRPESKMYGGNIDLVSRRENVQVVACAFHQGLLSF